MAQHGIKRLASLKTAIDNKLLGSICEGKEFPDQMGK
jgi:hypothetical protein